MTAPENEPQTSALGDPLTPNDDLDNTGLYASNRRNPDPTAGNTDGGTSEGPPAGAPGAAPANPHGDTRRGPLGDARGASSGDGRDGRPGNADGDTRERQLGDATVDANGAPVNDRGDASGDGRGAVAGEGGIGGSGVTERGLRSGWVAAGLGDGVNPTEIRVRYPERIAEGWQHRRRRELVGEDGRLLIVAADHPARGALGVRDDRMAMASRPALIDRLCTALRRPGVDGVLATPDILEDLLLLGALEGKVVIGSMNRGGLQGASFELDDRFTAYGTADDIAGRRLDGGKMLTRICLDDPGTVATLESSAQAVTELAERKLMAMVEPFWSVRRDGRVTNLLDPDSVIKSIHIASGLGATSAYTWLKLPVVDDLARVMEATTLPTLLLGGDPTVAPEETYASWGKALSLPSVRGLVVGRALLFPPDGDVAAAVDQASSLVHGGVA